MVAILLFDYTLWWWHRANHQVPFLWRFHPPHHVDLDLDASTALRFHFGGQTLSMAYRLMQILLIGTSAFQLWIWQTILFASMHGIHHSDRLNDTNSNWSSLLSAWDYLHRTMVLNVSQSEITIGVPAYEDPSEVAVGKALLLPFRRQRRDFHLPDGSLSLRPDMRTEAHHVIVEDR